jgi:hypothetical protein
LKALIAYSPSIAKKKKKKKKKRGREEEEDVGGGEGRFGYLSL